MVVFTRKWYPDCPTMSRSTSMTTHQSTWRSRIHQGEHNFSQPLRNFPIPRMGGENFLLWFIIIHVISSIVKYSRSIWNYSRILSKMDALNILILMSLIIVKRLNISENVPLKLLLLHQIKLIGLNILSIEFSSQIIPFNLQLGCCALIQTIFANILRQRQVS